MKKNSSNGSDKMKLITEFMREPRDSKTKKSVSDIIDEKFNSILFLEISVGLLIIILIILKDVSVEGLLTLILSYVLVTATIFYALSTSRNVKFTTDTLALMKKNQILEVEPSLELNIYKQEALKPDGKKPKPEKISNIYINLRNVGRGIAKEIDFQTIVSVKQKNKKIKYANAQITKIPYLMEGEDAWLQIESGQFPFIDYTSKINTGIKIEEDCLMIFITFHNLYNEFRDRRLVWNTSAIEYIDTITWQRSHAEKPPSSCILRERNKEFIWWLIQYLNKQIDQKTKAPIL